MACYRAFLIFCCALFQVSKSQTDVEACAILNCSLSMYILIGIAVLYFVFSLLCLVLIIIACNCKRRPRRQSRSRVKVQPSTSPAGNELDEVFCSSPHVSDGIGDATTTTDLNLDFFENPHAQEHLDSEHSSSSSSDGEEKSSESDQDTSFVIKNPSAKTKRHKHLTHSMQGKASPLLFHQPKSSPVPPKKVKVPFSDPDGPGGNSSPGRGGRVILPPLETTPRQRSRAAAASLNRRKDQSPFSRRKNPVAEIPKETSNKKSTPKINHVQRLEDQSAAIKKKGGVPIPASTLKFEMVKVSHKWRSIGEAFRLPSTALNNISIMCSNENDTCMLSVCAEWLKPQQRDWREVIDILQLERIGEKQLANYLRSTYLKPADGSVAQDPLVGSNSEGSLSWSETPAYPAGQKEEEAADESVSWPDESVTVTIL